MPCLQDEVVARPAQPSAPVPEQDTFAQRWQSDPSNSNPLPPEEFSSDMGARMPVESRPGGLPISAGVVAPALASPDFAPLALSPPLGLDFAPPPQVWSPAVKPQTNDFSFCAEGPVVMPRDARARSEERQAASQGRRRRSGASRRSATSTDRTPALPASGPVAQSPRDTFTATGQAPAVVPCVAGHEPATDRLDAGPFGSRQCSRARASEERMLNLLTDAGWDSIAFQDGEDLELLARAFLQQRRLNAAFVPGLKAQLLQMTNMRLLTASVDIVDLI